MENLKSVTDLNNMRSAGHLLLQLQKSNADKEKNVMLQNMGNSIYNYYVKPKKDKTDTSLNNAYKQIILYTEYEILTILSGKPFSIKKLELEILKNH